MISHLKRLWRMRPYLTSAFLLACAITVFFAGSFVYHAVYWSLHREVEIRPWMTVGYIARSWGLDPRELDRMAGLPLPVVKGHPQPLQEIAKDRGVPVEDIIADVERAMKDMRTAEPAP
jgi:hypothetical protein